MNIFISYSFENLEIVENISAEISSIGTVYYWDKDYIPGKPDWPQIFDKIADANVVLVVITGNTLARSMSVGQEIGYALDKGKVIIPIVTSEVSASDLGCLKGIAPVYLDKDNPGPAIQKVSYALSLKNKEIKFNQGVALGAVVVGTLWMLASGNDSK